MAVQEPPAEQDTPDNVTWLVLDARPGGWGVVWVLHRGPFHRTAQVPPGLANTEPRPVPRLGQRPGRAEPDRDARPRRAAGHAGEPRRRDPGRPCPPLRLPAVAVPPQGQRR